MSPSPSLFSGDGVAIAITFFWGRCHHHHQFFHARPKPRGPFFLGVAFPCSRVGDFWCFLGVAACRPRAPVKRTIAITSPRALFLHPSPSLWSRTGSHRHHFDIHHHLGGVGNENKMEIKIKIIMNWKCKWKWKTINIQMKPMLASARFAVV